MQSRMDEASSGATSSDQLASQYEATFAFFGAYLPEERQADLTPCGTGSARTCRRCPEWT